MNNANITPSPNISIKAVVKQAIVVNKVKVSYIRLLLFSKYLNRFLLPVKL